MSIVISTCVIIITVVVVVVGIEMIDTLKKIKSAAMIIEKTSRDIDDRVMDVEPAFKMFGNISSEINQFFSGLLSGIVSVFRKR